ncbi:MULTISPECIES: hypothetical protein [unclassified Salipiger]|uniref:hypothetical protein n=1 Tax=unclassified Salipiger TaxID=2640570 RepID=UPI0013B89935|nr:MULTISPECIES: hypothetical protein [unclassified Salipiger]NDV48728.1 hypothetical protein [Salipiger sp. PrR003]NDW33646.1 hypothetical protein [Salipiger sp. PrR007]
MKPQSFDPADKVAALRRAVVDEHFGGAFAAFGRQRRDAFTAEIMELAAGRLPVRAKKKEGR